MYSCPKYQLIYLAQPRAASRSISQFLMAHTQVRKSIGHHHVDRREIEFRKADGWRIVTVVRNHFDIIVSWWHHNPTWFRKRAEPDFSLFVSDFVNHVRNREVSPRRMYWKYQPFATDILHFESVWDELEPIVGFPISGSERLHVGKSDRKDYRDYYDDRTRAIVEAEYGDEMAKYGYEF